VVEEIQNDMISPTFNGMKRPELVRVPPQHDQETNTRKRAKKGDLAAKEIETM